ncbi:MAG: formylglycine-generating enzyme family protein [Planctomycetaceae bacterium]|nr:formylglycine-generating enzyme family protein [Planctomycetaceae bacterium]
MTELEALLDGIVSEPLEETRWLVLADWLEENDDPRRGELLRLHRRLLATCCEPEAHPERKAWQARIVELIAAGVRPCVPQRVVQLPGGVPMTFSFIPPGSFLMGGNSWDTEELVHKVRLTKGFFVGVHPVTQAQWRAVMGTDPSHFKGPNRPVENVSWDDCQEFSTKLTGDLKGTIRLLTESEWEYVCRAGTTSEYHFGDVLNTDLANYSGRESWYDPPKGKVREETTDVGLFPANPWGLYDVHGNVWEWCQDYWYGDDSVEEVADPPGPGTGQYRVVRGGSLGHPASDVRSANRDFNEPATRRSSDGFRVVWTL